MLVKLTKRNGAPLLIAPSAIQYIEHDDAGTEGAYLGLREGGGLKVAETPEQVEAALAQARRVKFTRLAGEPLYLAPGAVTGIGTFDAKTMVYAEGDEWAVRESLAEVLAALGWAQ